MNRESGTSYAGGSWSCMGNPVYYMEDREAKNFIRGIGTWLNSNDKRGTDEKDGQGGSEGGEPRWSKIPREGKR